MRLFLTLATLTFCASCAGLRIDQTALCSGTKQSRMVHAGALIDDGGPKSRATGATLLGQIEAGCGA